MSIWHLSFSVRAPSLLRVLRCSQRFGVPVLPPCDSGFGRFGATSGKNTNKTNIIWLWRFLKIWPPSECANRKKPNDTLSMTDSVDTALKKVDLNASDAAAVAAATTETTSDPTACSLCKKSKATKRCSKRHAKCLKKIFCDSVCETQVSFYVRKAWKCIAGEPQYKP